jgi:hypothetical protein
MQLQLRDYRIRHGQLDAWITAWKAHIVPIREATGFQVMGAWADRDNDRFVWVLRYDGADGFRAADARYYASPERLGLRPDPAELIDEARQTMVESVW